MDSLIKFYHTLLTTVSYIGIIDPAVLVLYSFGITSGVVVECGHSSTHIVPVKDSKLIREQVVEFPICRQNSEGNPEPYFIPTSLVDVVISVTEKSLGTDNEAFRNIILSGGASIPISLNFITIPKTKNLKHVFSNLPLQLLTLQLEVLCLLLFQLQKIFSQLMKM